MLLEAMSQVHFKEKKKQRTSQPPIHHMLPICLGLLIHQCFSYFPAVTGNSVKKWPLFSYDLLVSRGMLLKSPHPLAE